MWNDVNIYNGIAHIISSAKTTKKYSFSCAIKCFSFIGLGISYEVKYFQEDFEYRKTY